MYLCPLPTPVSGLHSPGSRQSQGLQGQNLPSEDPTPIQRHSSEGRKRQNWDSEGN